MTRKTTSDDDEPDVDSFYNINGNIIIVPHGHKLPEYQSNFKNYDKKLSLIVKQIDSINDPESNADVMIDIGANIGDTLASIRQYTKAFIYCIEGDSLYLPYLRKNSQRFDKVSIIDSYISGISNLNTCCIERNYGTARIRLSENDPNQTTIKSKKLLEIISENKIDVNLIKLIKIDTDGFDFSILLDNKNLIHAHRPNLFFEYDISFNTFDEELSLIVIKVLQENGYSVIIYDNFGNLIEMIEKDLIPKFKQYNHYLKSCREFGGGIYYLDIFASTNINLINCIVQND